MLSANGSPRKKNGLQALSYKQVTIDSFTNAYRPEKSVLGKHHAMTIKFQWRLS